MKYKTIQTLKTLRRIVYEAVGSPRYSRPGLNDLDRKLEPYLTKTNGFFVEAGGNDGFTQSNTYYLEKFLGWQGILVEGIPSLYQKAKQRRPKSHVFNNALVPFDKDGTEVEMIYGNLMSLVAGAMGSDKNDNGHIREAKKYDRSSGSYRVTVKGRALSSILDECKVKEIDFLSLDVEGYEGPVLRGLDFARHRPTYMLIEARMRNEVESIIQEYYKPIEVMSDLDVLYKIK
jgi:FkbM family methyltransferase